MCMELNSKVHQIQFSIYGSRYSYFLYLLDVKFSGISAYIFYFFSIFYFPFCYSIMTSKFLNHYDLLEGNKKIFAKRDIWRKKNLLREKSQDINAYDATKEFYRGFIPSFFSPFGHHNKEDLLRFRLTLRYQVFEMKVYIRGFEQPELCANFIQGDKNTPNF